MKNIKLVILFALTIPLSLKEANGQAQDPVIDLEVCPSVITDINSTPAYTECWTERHGDTQKGKASGIYKFVDDYLSLTTISAENKAIIANVVANRMAYYAGLGVTGLAASYGVPVTGAATLGYVASGYVYDGSKYVFTSLMNGEVPSLNGLQERTIKNTQALLYSLHQQGITLGADIITAATLESLWAYTDVRFTNAPTDVALPNWGQIDDWRVSTIVPGTIRLGRYLDPDTKKIIEYDQFGGALTYRNDKTTGTEAPPTPHRWNYDGDLVARRIAVSNDVEGFSQWPDYVFEDDYSLRPLSEVEAYIQENGHLPEVLSTEQVTEQGLDLVNMDITLLKKVEELTLYIIQQNKRIEQLEAQVKSSMKQSNDQ